MQDRKRFSIDINTLKTRFFFLSFFFLLSIFGCSSTQKKAPSDSVHSTTKVEQHFPVTDEVEDYLRDLGERLESVARNSDSILSFSVAETNLVQAISSSDGDVEVTAGMLFVAQNEAQVAGVLAHEIGHQLLHYESAQQNQEKRILETFDHNHDFPFSEEIRNFFEARWSAKKENEADVFAVNLLAKLGYDPYEFATLLESLSKLDDSFFIKKVKIFRSTHDTLATRAKSLKAYLANKGIKEQQGITGEARYLFKLSDILPSSLPNKTEDKELTQLIGNFEKVKKKKPDQKDFDRSVELSLLVIKKYGLDSVFQETEARFMEELIFVGFDLALTKNPRRGLIFIAKHAKYFSRYGKPLIRELRARLSKRNTAWKLGSFKSPRKWESQMTKRGWDEKQITEAIKYGKKYKADNRVYPGNRASRYTHPDTGKSVVRDDVNGEILQVGGETFKHDY